MPMFFDRLHEALQILSEFFYADGAGLSEGKLYTDNFNELNIQFSLNGVSVQMWHEIAFPLAPGSNFVNVFLDFLRKGKRKPS